MVIAHFLFCLIFAAGAGVGAGVINVGKAEQPVKIVFFGDSITKGWKDKRIFAGGVLNRGVNGQTTSDMRERFGKDVLNLKPRVVHMLMGTNDVAGNSGAYSFEKTTGNIRWMCGEAKAHGIRVVLGSVLPVSSYYWQPSLKPVKEIERLNAWLKAYAAEEKFVYIDYFTPMNDGTGGMKKELTGDGVHPNEKGYEVMSPLVMQALGEF